MLRSPASPGSEKRNFVTASSASAHALGRLSTALRIVAVSGTSFGSSSDALPCKFQLVGQQERQFWTLNGNPLVHRVSPDTDQSPMIPLTNPLALVAKRRPWPNGMSQIQLKFT